MLYTTRGWNHIEGNDGYTTDMIIFTAKEDYEWPEIAAFVPQLIQLSEENDVTDVINISFAADTLYVTMHYGARADGSVIEPTEKHAKTKQQILDLIVKK